MEHVGQSPSMNDGMSGLEQGVKTQGSGSKGTRATSFHPVLQATTTMDVWLQVVHLVEKLVAGSR
ncbi:MAG: hypothetical protein CBC35_01190 [Planctomycetes bacterium TMED75]|nr:MAG: hypothetical protein CBC35_01190 [Planctomycetes bacterium TMED75]